MKRTFIVFAIAFLLVGSLAICKEDVVIDFTLLDTDVTVKNDDGEEGTEENSRTLMDYATAAGATFTDEQKGLMKTSLALDNWEVDLNSSARNPSSLSFSRVVSAEVSEDSKHSGVAGKNVMGVRIVFPDARVNANARIVPPFEIPAYETMVDVDENGNYVVDEEGNRVNSSEVTTTRFEGGYGVVKNVGTIKALSVTTMGMQYPHALYVLLKDTDNIERRYYMGSLNFDGWKELKWENPNYISDILTRELRMYPIYPRGLPFVKFVGFQVVRDAADIGGDFIGYFKDVKIIYDKALLTSERDIADEGLWHIVTDREARKQNEEMRRFGNKQVDRFLEERKQATESQFTSSLEESEESEQ